MIIAQSICDSWAPPRKQSQMDSESAGFPK